ncbi:hypothetical protein B296_00023978 [Ensete ventricosum]|uniref:Uncharacterized protein n=1 Tax=Ensete ventricosum TaxID=4639 RepID=A0A426YHB4_ENSVE|nr:hypothetical protein B296_00023978 [Ensete ventricosum]
MTILHKGLFGDGRGDPERPLRCPRELVRTPSLTFVVPRDVAETYEGRAATAVWGEGMTHHATLMDVGPGSAIPDPPPRITDWLPSWSLRLTWLPPKCCHGCPSGVGLDESDQPIGYPIKRALAKKFSSNSFADKSNKDIEAGLR